METKEVALMSLLSFKKADSEGKSFLKKQIEKNREVLENADISVDTLVSVAYKTFEEGLAAGYINQMRCIQLILKTFLESAQKNNDEKAIIVLLSCINMFQAEEENFLKAVPFANLPEIQEETLND